ncbi:MAG: ABC transporter substrate-binding protein [Acidimicrobiales bacterium]
MKLGVVVALAVVALAGCSSGDGDGGRPSAGGPAATSTTTPGVPTNLTTLKQGVLTACVEVPNAPFSFEEAGEKAGIAVDLVRALGGRLALSAEFVVVAVGGLPAAVQAGQCDLGAGAVAVDSALPEGLVFSDAYFTVEQSLLVRGVDQDSLRDLASLRGKRVGVRSGATGAAFTRTGAPDATVIDFATSAEATSVLQRGEIDAVVQDFPDNAANATTTGATVVTATFPEAGKRQYALVIPAKDPALVSAVNTALAQVRSDDTFPTVLRRYLGATTGQPAPAP